MHEAGLRLTCPNCGATYALDATAMPPGGSHVQCGECHTRWFARPEAPPPTLGEDEILARLETRAARPRLAGGTDAAPPREQAGTDAPAVVPSEVPPAQDATGLAEAAAPGRAARDAEEPPSAAAPADAPPGGGIAGVTRPPSGGGAAPVTPLRPRGGAGRIAPTGAAPERPAPPARRGFLPGLAAAIALAAAGLAVYLLAGGLQARAPAAAPALSAYVGGVDAARDWIETRLGPVRDALAGG